MSKLIIDGTHGLSCEIKLDNGSIENRLIRFGAGEVSITLRPQIIGACISGELISLNYDPSGISNLNTIILQNNAIVVLINELPLKVIEVLGNSTLTMYSTYREEIITDILIKEDSEVKLLETDLSNLPAITLETNSRFSFKHNEKAYQISMTDKSGASKSVQISEISKGLYFFQQLKPIYNKILNTPADDFDVPPGILDVIGTDTLHSKSNESPTYSITELK